MTRKYNPKTVQKPLSQVVAERRGFYESRMAKTFDAVYSSGNFQYIERFEGVVLGLSQRAAQGNLEGIVIKPLEQPQVAQVQLTSQTIDFEQYKKARQSGMSHQQIATKHPNVDSHTLGAYSANLSRWKKVQDAADPRTQLTYELFVAARNAGVTNKQIIDQYKREYPQQINVFSMEYAKAKKKVQAPAVQQTQ